MTDKELLELAAKAAGFTDAEWAAEQASISTLQAGKGFKLFWNPLADDGDALRLSVKLHIDITQDPHGYHQVMAGQMLEPLADDSYAATRRAIVRAAAEIGKDMK